MNPAKIQLSTEELLLVKNADLLLTKNKIIGKVRDMFALLSQEVQGLFIQHPFFPQEIFTLPPKISKGENHKGLPYLILDYPRLFGKSDTFAIRSMFWWGNFFSITLHVKGKYKNILAPRLKEELVVFITHDFFMSINNDEWRHDFEKDNYIAIKDADEVMLTEHLLRKDFCKLSVKIPLDEWEEVPAKLVTLYKIIIQQLYF